MATIGIKGIRVESLDIKFDDGNATITSQYALISTADKVLAKQSVGGYGGMDIKPSASTIGKLNGFLSAYRADLTTVLGLDAA